MTTNPRKGRVPERLSPTPIDHRTLPNPEALAAPPELKSAASLDSLPRVIVDKFRKLDEIRNVDLTRDICQV